MKIVPRSVVEIDYSIPHLPTNEQIESTLYEAEGWTPNLDEEKEATILTFADIKEFFDGWDQFEDYCWRNNLDKNDPNARDEYERDLHWDTVYDYITDCLHWYGGAFWPVHIVEGKE